MKSKGLSAFLVALLLFSLFPPSALSFGGLAEEPLVDRISGKNRYETAVAISQAGWETSDYVVLARGDQFADALAGVPLAYSLDAPILLTKPTGLHDATRQELVRLGAKTVVILGGEGAVSKAVENKLKTEMLLTTERIAGTNRFDTAGQVARRMQADGSYKGKVIVANGQDFPDALAASAYAARRGYPIILCADSRIPAASQSALSDLTPEASYVVGGTGVISDQVMAQLTNPQRISGKNRYTTAIELATFFEPGNTRYYVATGTEFADAIAGGVLAAKNDAGLLLVSKIVPEVVKEYIAEYNVQSAAIFGGTGAVSDTVEESIRNIIAPTTLTMGNTAGNIQNDGMVAISGGWVFYSAEDGGIFRMRDNGDNNEKICDDDACYLNVMDGWVYYVNRDDNYSIYRMRISGDNREPINNETSSSINLANGWLWYVADDWEEETSNICRIRPDGSGREVLAVSNPWDDFTPYSHCFADIQIVDDWVYYLSEETQFDAYYDVYRLDLETGKKDKTFCYNFWDVESFNTYLIQGNTLWYSGCDWYGVESIYRVDLETKTSEVIYQDNLPQTQMNTEGDWIYFYTYDWNEDKAAFYRMNLDGSNLQLLHEFGRVYNVRISLANGWVYIHSTYFTSNPFTEYLSGVYRMRPDGSNFEQIRVREVRFTVTDENGDPIEEAWIWVDSGDYCDDGYTDCSGNMTLNLPAGDYDYDVRAYGFFKQYGTFSVPADSELNIVLESLGE